MPATRLAVSKRKGGEPMNRRSVLTGVLLFSAFATAAWAADPAPEKGKGMTMKKPAATDAQLVSSAMKAAPMVRKGTNGWTCMPDNPETPGVDPMCVDANAMAWAQAWMSHQNPPAGKVGFAYMLAGGTDASNTDPYAKKPEANNHWIKTGPHVMIVGAEASFYDNYPKKADPDTSQPYVMWAGTPYQHLMAPVK
jgi:hypothetical protein